MESVNLLDSTWIVSCYVLATAKSMSRHLESLKNSFKAGIIDMFFEGLVNVHSFQVIIKTYLQTLNRARSYILQSNHTMRVVAVESGAI